MTRVEDLTQRLVDNRLSGEEAEELHRLVTTDPVARKVYLSFLNLEASLRGGHNERDVTEGTMMRLQGTLAESIERGVMRQVSALRSEVVEGHSPRPRRSARPTPRRRRPRNLLVPLAASAAIVAGLLVLVLSSNRHTRDRSVVTGPRPGDRAPAASRHPGGASHLPAIRQHAESLREERPGAARSSDAVFAPSIPENDRRPPFPLAPPPLPPLSYDPKDPNPAAAIASVRPGAKFPAEQTPPADQPASQSAIARVERIAGYVLYARGGQGHWKRAIAGISLLPGDRLDTRTGMARLAMDGGATVYASRGTVLQALRALTGDGEAHLLNLSRGELYVESGKKRVHVESADGLFSPVGTRFDVKRTRIKTILVVLAGAVRAQVRKAQPGQGRLPTPEVTLERRIVDLRRLDWVSQTLHVRQGQRARVRRGTRGRVSAIPKSFRPWWRGLAESREVATVPAVVSFTLIDADADLPIPEFDPLPNGAILNLRRLPSRNLNIRVNVSTDQNIHVKFRLQPPSPRLEAIQKMEPYAVFGDNDPHNDYEPWTPKPGLYTLTATPYVLRAGQEVPGRALTIRFRIIDRQ